MGTLAFFVWYAFNQSGKWSIILAPLAKSLFIYMQTSSLLFSRSSAFVWPSSVVSFFTFVYGWTSASVSMLTCFGNGSNAWELAYLLTVLAIPAMVVIVCVLYVVLASFRFCTAHGLFGRSELHWRYGGIRTALALLNLVYMPLTVGVLMALPCRS